MFFFPFGLTNGSYVIICQIIYLSLLSLPYVNNTGVICLCVHIHRCSMIRNESWTHMKVCSVLLQDRERGRERGKEGGRECVCSR